ncbi:MAG: SBBP repeat-containing protein [Blastocatellia bacterium]
MKKTIVLTLLSLTLVCGLVKYKSEARMASSHIAAGSFAQNQLTLSIDDVTVTEGTNPAAVFTVTLNFPGGFRDFNTTVDYATSNGTASAPGDYTQSSGTLTFRAGASPATMTISIPIVDDSVFEGTETFTVTLSNPTTTSPFPISISRGSGICTIFDNEPAPPNSPTLSISDVTVTEGNAGTTNAVFTVSLSAASNLGVTVNFATADGTATVADNDYNSTSGTLTFSPLVTTMTISVVIVGDTRVEGGENFFVNLSNPSAATIADGQGVCTIIDDDAAAPTLPSLVISDVTVAEGNVGMMNATFIVNLSPVPATSPVTVNFATADGAATVADNDYIGASGTVTFLPGDSFGKVVTVRVVGDARGEGTENFFVNLSNPSGATIADGQGVGTIIDDDLGCAYAVAPASQIRGPGRESGFFTVIAPPVCAWEAKSGASWISLLGFRSGIGEGTISYSVEANENPLNGSSNRRSGTITIFPQGSSTPGAVFTVIQEGLSCTFRVSPLETVVQADGDIAHFSVTAPEGCRWEARSLSDFITIFSIFPPLDTSGDGSASFSVGGNRGPFRSGVVRVAGQDVTIYQNTRDCPEEFVCRILPIACAPPDSNLLGTSRQFRDQVLSKSERGQRYTRLYYDFSSEIVRRMIFHPSLVLRSLEIKERYLPVIEAMVKGKDVTLTEGDLEEIDGFLNVIAARGSRELQETIKGVRADLRDPRVHAEFGVKVTAGPKRELISAASSWWPLVGDWFTTQGAKSACDSPPASVRTQSASDQATRAREAFGKLPMRFELNQGQTDSQVKFFARGPGYGLFLTPNEATLRLRIEDRGSRIEDRGLRIENHPKRDDAIFNLQSSILDPQSSVLRMKLAGANPDPLIRGLDELPGKTKYFMGQDQSRWRAQVPSFARVKYENVYKGVDLVYYGNQGQLEYDFIVAPGADPSAIKLAFDGADKMQIDAKGDLVLHTPGGQVRQRKPLVYQEVNGARREIPSRYTIRDRPQEQLAAIRNPQSAIRNQEVAIEVGDYDATKPLIIDPVLVYSTYLGGSGIDEGSSIAVDAAGQVYVAGFTDSLDFPLAGAAQPSAGGGQDAFVAKLNAAGTQLIYATYLGGSDQDNAVSIAADAAGNAYVTGFTASPNFPAMNAMQPARKGPFNSFVTKLNATGAVVYSTYLGGSRADFGSSVAIDSAGNVYVTGITASTDFPMANALQPAFGGVSDAYVAKLDPSGARLLFSTYLGGAATDGATSVAVDAEGNVYVAGVTNSSDLRTANPLQSRHGGGLSDGFVAKLNPIGNGLVYATYLGGSRVDRIFRLVVDAAGAAYVTGDTDSADFPTANAQQPFYRGGTDAFVAKINPSGSALVYSTYLSGGGIDGGSAIAVEPSGNAVVTGFTASAGFPTVRPVQQNNGGGTFDAFVARFDPQGRLNYSTYLGGSGSDSGFGVAVDPSGNAYVMGLTDSTNFPVANPLQRSNGGAHDLFIARLDPDPIIAAVPIITGAEVLRDGKLLVLGKEFDLRAQVLIDGQPKPTRNDIFNPSTRLVASVDMRDARPGDRVTLQVRNHDGMISPDFTFTLPLRRAVTER